jgi:hypothetical protein
VVSLEIFLFSSLNSVTILSDFIMDFLVHLFN